MATNVVQAVCGHTTRYLYTHNKGFITSRQTACSPVKTKQRPRIASNLLAIDFPIYEETDMFLCPIPSTSAYRPIRS